MDREELLSLDTVVATYPIKADKWTAKAFCHYLKIAKPYTEITLSAWGYRKLGLILQDWHLFGFFGNAWEREKLFKKFLPTSVYTWLRDCHQHAKSDLYAGIDLKPICLKIGNFRIYKHKNTPNSGKTSRILNTGFLGEDSIFYVD